MNKHYFFNMEFIALNGVYKPKYETEHIIDLIKKIYKKESSIVEIGGGTGCIGISLSKIFNHHILIIEKNKIAYKNCILNKKIHKANVTIICQDAIKTNINCDILITNPPYIKTKTAIMLSKKFNFSIDSLDGGNSGIEFITQIIINSINIRYIIFEFGYYNNIKTIRKITNENKFHIKEIYKPIKNLNVYFALIENTRYWT